MLVTLIVVLTTLYLVFTIACWRIACYFCVNKRWLLLIPVANLIYFAHISDVVAVETVESKTSYNVWAMVVLFPFLVVSGLLQLCRRYEVVLLVSRIGIILSIVFIILVFCWCYMIILENSFNFPTLVCLLSLIIPFPVWLFIASFTIRSKTEEVIELYWG